MQENTNSLSPRRTERKIGGTVYIINTSYNGSKKRNLFESLARLIERDLLSPSD